MTMKFKLEQVLPVYSMELSSFQDELSAFHMSSSI
ncbi:hypothetical protein PC116_g13474 [Phytophthora cactorum]|uniref:Uncharacterized protein n=1 Tax=Phytophthora cactorum TaxID=29920 RepID=A0A8T1KVE1_9STRA|nr:hypothetical protein PC114_g25644 [Phytophthora cactorum]KAG2888026.1 hypothetical protein PC117_g25026 [Phytophthora cactorum]KAG2964262.1 hypothetical protein PC119_g25294 [Phytophthora cactorum]KAG2977812.1 hypothetical protein PC120_g25429 [Phytophthora cactorum]KAG3042768.1 hypothetical protein PC121_g22968 [Phytophthora cactorum]